MANDYYNGHNPSTQLIAGALVRAEDLNARFIEIELAFDKIPSPVLINSAIPFVLTGVGHQSSVIVAQHPLSLTGLAIGLNVTLKMPVNNASGQLINVSGLGVYPIVDQLGHSVAADYLVVNQLVNLHFTGTALQVIGSVYYDIVAVDRIKAETQAIKDSAQTQAQAAQASAELALSAVNQVSSQVIDLVKLNDGHGSGLDADTLDGKHLSEIALPIPVGVTLTTDNRLFVFVDEPKYEASNFADMAFLPKNALFSIQNNRFTITV